MFPLLTCRMTLKLTFSWLWKHHLLKKIFIVYVWPQLQTFSPSDWIPTDAGCIGCKNHENSHKISPDMQASVVLKRYYPQAFCVGVYLTRLQCWSPPNHLFSPPPPSPHHYPKFFLSGCNNTTACSNLAPYQCPSLI